MAPGLRDTHTALLEQQAAAGPNLSTQDKNQGPAREMPKTAAETGPQHQRLLGDTHTHTYTYPRQTLGLSVKRFLN